MKDREIPEVKEVGYTNNPSPFPNFLSPISNLRFPFACLLFPVSGHLFPVSSLLLTAIAVFIFGALLFYKKQNSNESKLGGPISKAKVVWLFFALFQYFFFPAFLYLSQENSVFHPILWTVFLLFLIRMGIQLLMMFAFKKWSPWMGISFNLLVVYFITKMLFNSVVLGPLLSMSTFDYCVFLYLLLVLAMLITDSYYAWQFYKVVGKRTMGDSAIWYVSENNTAFKKINQITFFLNVVFLVWFVVVLTKLIPIL